MIDMLLYMTYKRTEIYFSRRNIAQIYNIRENGLIYNKTLPLYTQKKIVIGQLYWTLHSFIYRENVYALPSNLKESSQKIINNNFKE